MQKRRQVACGVYDARRWHSDAPSSEREAYAAGEKLLKFTDLFGSLSYVPVKDFHGLWETTKEIRQASEDFHTALKEEEKEYRSDKPWEDS